MASQLGVWATLSGRYNSGLWTPRDNRRWKPLLEKREKWRTHRLRNPRYFQRWMWPTRPPSLMFPPGTQQKGFFKNSSSAFVLGRPSALFLSGKRPNRTI